MMRVVLAIIPLVAGCTSRPATTPPGPPPEVAPREPGVPARNPAIASVWLLGSGGFMGGRCVSVWVDASGAASLTTVSADENSFRLSPDFHRHLMRDLAEAWSLGDAGVPVPGDDLICYTLIITGTDGSTRSFRYSDGAAKPPELERIHKSLLSIIPAGNTEN